MEGLPGERRRRALVQSKDRAPHKCPAGWAVGSQQGLQTAGVTLALARPPTAGGPAQVWEAEPAVEPALLVPGLVAHKASITDLGPNLGLCDVGKSPNDHEP